MTTLPRRRSHLSSLGRWTRHLMIAPAALALVAATSPATRSEVDWAHYGNSLHNDRYQNLDQITPGSVGRLKPAWTFHTGDVKVKESFEASPIMVGGTLFVPTGTDKVFALDAATGRQSWMYKPKLLAPPSKLSVCCGLDNRGVAYGDGKIFLGRLDGVLVALDARTGKVDWQTRIADWKKGYSITMAPQFADGKVIVGVSGGEYAIEGRVTAVDASSGRTAWTFNTVKPDTWAGDSWKNGGVPVWGNPSIDPQLGLVYVVTGNASPDFNGSKRAGADLYSASDVALNLNTGKVRWAFQEVHHDIWDYDGPSPAMLFDVRTARGTVPALGHCGKGGQYFILDRRTGRPVFPVRERRVPAGPAWQHAWPTQPFSSVEPLTPIGVQNPPSGYGYDYKGYFTPPTNPDEVEQPGTEAGCEWPPAAFSPRTGYIYYGARYEPTGFLGHPGAVKSPNDTKKDTGSAFVRPIQGVDYWGYFGATDSRTGKIVWKHKLDQAPLTGAAVAGDLVFYGETNGKVHAADAQTGKVLWTFDTPKQVKGAGGADGAWSVYRANGREYVVSVFGGSAMERHLDEDSPVGDTVVAFALPAR